MKPVKLSTREAAKSFIAQRVRETTGGNKYPVTVINEIIEAYNDVVVEQLASGAAVPIRGIGKMSLSVTPVSPKSFGGGEQKYNFLAKIDVTVPENNKARIRHRICEFFDITDAGEVFIKCYDGSRKPISTQKREEKKYGRRGVLA